ncbi:MAG: SBBP repeat-containing protein [Pseudohongiella sp.]|nr:SBBP repeat-containing protein [Pseudohongiella sp.]
MESERLNLRASLVNVIWIAAAFCTLPLLAQELPEIAYSTYYGGSGTDDCDAVAVDSDGNAYLGCHLNSPTLPGSDRYGYTISGGMDAFVVKLNSVADAVEYITHLGGSEWDAVLGLTTDLAGNVYAVGSTYSADFPVSADAAQSEFGGESDVFVVKLNADGETLWVTYFGGNGEEESNDIVLDSDGNVHIAGRTSSTDLNASAGAVQQNYGGGTDAFIASFDSQGRVI